MENKTLASYNKYALIFAEKFNKSGARTGNIKHSFSFFPDHKNLNVLEIGCGNGRDAKEILKYTQNYIGLDYSEGMLSLAKNYIPEGNFVLGDIENFDTNDRFDIIFSFASLVHLPRNRLKIVLSKLHTFLNKDGIIYLSLKYNKKYIEKITQDEFGERFFALYNNKAIKELINGYEIIYENVVEVNKQFWLEMILKK